MPSVDEVVFLLDVDNTLLNNDAVIDDLRRYMREALGAEHEQRYWDIFEACRAELGYADYLGALERYRGQFPADCHLLEVSLFLLAIRSPSACTRAHSTSSRDFENAGRWSFCRTATWSSNPTK